MFTKHPFLVVVISLNLDATISIEGASVVLVLCERYQRCCV